MAGLSGVSVGLIVLFGLTPDFLNNPNNLIAYILLILVAAIAAGATGILFYRARHIKADILELYEDGFIFHGKHDTAYYLWWLNLVSYQTSGNRDFPQSMRLVLNTDDGKHYTFTNRYRELAKIIKPIPKFTSDVLLHRMTEQLRAGNTVNFGELEFTTDVLRCGNKTASWTDILFIKHYADIKRYVIWICDHALINAEIPPIPQRFAVLDEERLPNREVFTEFFGQLSAYKGRYERLTGKRTGLIDLLQRWRAQTWIRMRPQLQLFLGCLLLGLLCIGIDRIWPTQGGIRVGLVDNMAALIPWMGLAYLGIGTVGGIRGLLILLQTQLSPEVVVALYDNGIAANVGEERFTCQWDELEGYLFVGKRGLKILRTDGKKVRLDGSIQDFDQWIPKFQYAADQPLRQRVEARLQAGETIEFGDLKVTLDTLTFRDKTIQYDRLVTYKTDFRTMLTIYYGERLSPKFFARINLGLVMNSGVLLDFLDQMIEFNAQNRS